MTVRITNPTAYRDQIRAAGAHARRRLTDAHTHGLIEPDPAPPRRWLAEQYTILLTAIEDGTAQLCPHAGRGGPRMLAAAAWSPGTLVCGDCTDQLDLNPDNRDTCDRCHQHARTLTGSIGAVGPLMFAYALCNPCTNG